MKTLKSSRFAVVIASKGRPKVLGETLESVFRLHCRPQVVLITPGAADLRAGFVPWPENLQWSEGCAHAWLDMLPGRCRPSGILRL